MARYISEVQLPDSTIYNIKDSSKSGVYFVRGTQVEQTRYFTGNLHNVTELYEGLTIAYYLPFSTSGSAAYLELTLDDNTTTGRIPLYYTGTSALTTQYTGGSCIILTLINIGSTTPPTWTWRRCDYNSNTNTYVIQSFAANDYNRPLLLSYYEVGATSTSANVSYRNEAFYANPATGILVAPHFHGDVVLPNDPVNNMQAATKQYVDAKTTNIGTITGVQVNGTSIATSGVANIPAASLNDYGVTKLSDSINTTSSVLAASSTAVKTVYDLANGKQDAIVFNTPYDASTNKAATMSDIIEYTAGTGLSLNNTTFNIAPQYGICNTQSDVADKVVTNITGFALITGITIFIKFTYANTAAAPTLNINNLGAKQIYLNNGNVSPWNDNETISLTYDGIQWNINNYGKIEVVR